MITVVIMTQDEELHIARAIASVASLAERVFVVDSGSTDGTVRIARELGATIGFHAWVNHAAQFNWALAQLPGDTEWVLRLDADEIVTPGLASEIRSRLPGVGGDVEGIYVGRRMAFMGRPIRHGGVFPVRVLRLFRHGKASCENRWMDEHLSVAGATADFREEILDDSRKSLSWWTQKHNDYASKEVVDILNREYRFLPYESVGELAFGKKSELKRWFKESVYYRLPAGARAWSYFLYRYVLRLGVLDGPEGRSFHVLQALWYRFLVDSKLREVRTHMRTTGADPVAAIEATLGMRLHDAG